MGKNKHCKLSFNSYRSVSFLLFCSVCTRIKCRKFSIGWCLNSETIFKMPQKIKGNVLKRTNYTVPLLWIGCECNFCNSVIIFFFLHCSLSFSASIGFSCAPTKHTTHTYKKKTTIQNIHTQIGLALVAVCTLVISGIVGYTALCVTAWGYGLALGCYRYTLKMLALERVRAKHFTKAWGKYTYMYK